MSIEQQAVDERFRALAPLGEIISNPTVFASYMSFCRDGWVCPDRRILKSNTLDSLIAATSELDKLKSLCEQSEIKEQGLLTSDSDSVYGPLLDILHDPRMLRPFTWPTWVRLALRGEAANKALGEICGRISCKVIEAKRPTSLREALESMGHHSPSMAQGLAGISPDIIIKATVWAAFSNFYHGKDLVDSYLQAWPRIAEDAEHLLSHRRANDSEESARWPWRYWLLLVALRGDGARKVGEIAMVIKDGWPSNRIREELNQYIVEKPNQLISRRGIGRKKVRTIVRCFAHAAIHGPGNPEMADGDPISLLKSLNLPTLYNKALRLRFAKRGIQTLEFCGMAVGVTRERVRQMEKKAAKLAKATGKHLLARKWLEKNRERAWAAMSLDGGMTVDPTSTGNSFHAKLPGDIQLGLLLGDMLADELMDMCGNKVDDWWVRP